MRGEFAAVKAEYFGVLNIIVVNDGVARAGKYVAVAGGEYAQSGEGIEYAAADQLALEVVIMYIE